MSSERPIRVMVVDDHAVVRSGLNAFLSSYDDLQMAGTAKSGEEAVQLCEEIKPDVVLMDLIMPGMDGVAATKAIRKLLPKTQVIILTSFKEDTMIQKAIQAGAIGYLLKDVQADEIAEAIRLVNAGQSILSPEATQALMRVANQPRQLGYDLSDRELEVLALMVKGLNNTEIAEKLVVSLSTIKHHVSHILSKLDATNRSEAVALAVQNHLVE
ncbi:Response regulator protein VraR [bioreactor metagenome]|uniref:Response regulator protein VraR n=1 Tax=bioreactor metagenome TaxID=1076179 RepID=A0A645DQB7_9ZZZZ